MHNCVDTLVYHEDYQSDNKGSKHYYHSTIREFLLRWPGYFMNKFIVRILYISKYFQFLHILYVFSTG